MIVTSSLITAILSFIFGLIILLKEKSSLSKAWFVLSVNIALWALSLYGLAASSVVEIAELWQYFSDVVQILLPVTYFYFVTVFLKINVLRQVQMISGIAVLLSVFSFSSFFKFGVIQKFGAYWINPGPYYFVSPLFFAIIIAYSIYLLVRAYRKEVRGSILRSQIMYQILAGVVGFSGGATNFLPQIINVFPFGNYFVLLYVFFISYSILKYHLFNLKLIIVELAILLLNLFLFLNVFTSHAKADLILNVSVSAFILAFSIFLIRGIYKDIRDRERIEGLVKDMEVANERLRMMEGQKTEFVSIASHQLRTPLTVIKGYASMILEGTFGRISDEARDAMEKLYKSSEKIVALVEDLLTVSRIEQGRIVLNLENVNFSDFVQVAISEVQETADADKIDLSFTAEEGKEFIVAIDEKKFKQVLVHILENAIKYNTASGSVRVLVEDDSLTRKIRVSISDTGIGMKPEQITSIFERFNLKANMGVKQDEHGDTFIPTVNEKQVAEKEAEESAMMEKRTPGIGLYIAQEIIEAHHGTLRIESAGPDRGTTVIVELPKAEKEM